VFTGSWNTKPSEAMLRNISQNMYGAIVVRSDCAIAGRTWLYCKLPMWRTPLSVIGTGLSLALARQPPAERRLSRGVSRGISADAGAC
jgi:hypothetical protein